jgi:hypothetical protein
MLMSAKTLRLYDGFDHTSPELRGAVGVVQAELQRHDEQVVVDGCFGFGTERAVRDFQSACGLREDGVVGPGTWQALEVGPAGANPSLGTSHRLDQPLLLEEHAVAARHGPAIEAAAVRFGLAPALIVALGSRQSRLGLALTPEGPTGTADLLPRNHIRPPRCGPLPVDGLGFLRGLMGLDYDIDEVARSDAWRDPATNIAEACRLLCALRSQLRRRTTLHGGGLLRGALAAYNCGLGNVLRAVGQGLDLDFYTVGRHFGAEVLDRAGFFEAQGWD